MNTVRFGINGIVEIPIREIIPITNAIGAPRNIRSTKSPTISIYMTIRRPYLSKYVRLGLYDKDNTAT